MERKIRILIAIPGLDGHDCGAIAVAQACRDAGMEVVYLGTQQTPEAIAAAAIAEDVDVIGLSGKCGTPICYFPEVVQQLNERGSSDICIVGGGNISKEEKVVLEREGITGNFTSGTPLKVITDYITDTVKGKRWQEKS